MIFISIQSEDVVIHAISHNIRREILKLLDSQPKTFSELLNHFDLSTGKLSYHLNQIKGFIQKDSDNKYELTSLGLKAIEIFDVIKEKVNTKEQPLIKAAFVSQKEVTKPLILHGINLGIGGLVFMIFITGFLFVVLFMNLDSVPIVIWPIIIFMGIGEFMGLFWIIRVRRKAPVFIERLDKHLKGSD